MIIYYLKIFTKLKKQQLSILVTVNARGRPTAILSRAAWVHSFSVCPSSDSSGEFLTVMHESKNGRLNLQR